MIIESFQLDFLLLLRKKYEGGSESQRVAIEAEVKVPFLWLLKKISSEIISSQNKISAWTHDRISLSF